MVLTGSQEAPLMQGVTESMAGRAAGAAIAPALDARSDRVSLLHGGYPEAWRGRARRACGSVPTCRPTWSATCGR